jgi:hypothetical protein
VREICLINLFFWQFYTVRIILETWNFRAHFYEIQISFFNLGTFFKCPDFDCTH